MNYNSRRKSFPPQKDLSHKTIPAVEEFDHRYPLTEENLAIHTKNYPPCKDARKRNCKKFVENQIPFACLEMELQREREQEISSLELQEQPIKFVNPFSAPSKQEKSTKPRWFSKLKNWIRLDSPTKQRKTRHLSWSAGTEKEDHKTIDTTCQKRDSGISIFSSHAQRRRSSPITAIPISRQPKFSPACNNGDEFVSYQYPKTRRKSSIIRTVAAADGDNSNTATLDCKGSAHLNQFKAMQNTAAV